VSAKPYTAERAYRVSVRPLAIFLILGGLLLPALAVLCPSAPDMPFAESPIARRILMAVLGFFFLPIGIGLYLKLKVAWYAMLVYLVFGTVFGAIGVWVDEAADTRERVVLMLFAVLINGVLTVGLYFVTRPVFSRPRRSEDNP